MDKLNAFECRCPRGYYGPRCEHFVDLDKYNATVTLEKKHCTMNQCDKKAADGHCNPECNHFACDYDGGDCSAKSRPFENCAEPSFCSHVFADGKCDEVSKAP